jgi:uncharacterized repeat protein (TIGR03847 family)
VPQVFEYDPPDRFVAGTVGEPGQRTFYLQARGAGRITTVALEKQQVAALAERVDEVLDEVLRRTGGAGAPAVAPTALDDKAPLDQPIEEDFRVGTLALAWDGADGVLVIEAHQVALTDVTDEDDDGADDDGAGEDGAGDDGAGDDGAAEDGDIEDGDVVDDGAGADDTGDVAADPATSAAGVPVGDLEEVGDVLRVRLSPAVARAFAQRAAAVVGAGRPPCPFCGLPLDASGHVCPRQNGYRRR